METYLGLDLGGTKLLIGEMDSRGNILRYKKYVPQPIDAPYIWIDLSGS